MYEFVSSKEPLIVCLLGLEVLYGAERNFTSEGYPNVYPSNAEYAWIIHGGIRVELTFHSFDLQWCRDCSCDYVEVRDGFTSLSPLIGRYCGNHTEPITVISSSEFVYVSFKTDSSISGAGFNASYTITISKYFHIARHSTDRLNVTIEARGMIGKGGNSN